MNCKAWQQMLRETGTYDTGAEGTDVREPWLGRYDWWFHVHALGIYIRGCALACVGRYGDLGWATSSFLFLRLYEACGARVHIRGSGNLQHTPAVVVANHMSMAETFLLPVVLLAHSRLAIVIKRSLTRYPFFGQILQATDPIRVTRKNAREDLRTVLEKGAAALAAGRSVLIFPQYTRNPRFDPKLFNSIGVKLASRAGVPLIPVALKTDFHGLGRIIKDAGRMDRSKEMHFCVGAPLTVDGNEKDVQRKAIEFIAGKLREWGGETAEDNVNQGTHD